MFRIGSLCYIPAYLSVVLYRVFASDKDDGNLVLMGGELRRLVMCQRYLILGNLFYSIGNQHVSLPSLYWPFYSTWHSWCSAIRFCGITFSYTAIAVLLNYST
jgi:hypothetical protein